MPAPILQQILELDGAIGHKVIVADGGIVEDGQLDLPAIADVGGEVIVPGWAVGLLLSGGLADPGVVHIDGNVGVQQKGLGSGPHRVPQGPSRGLQVDSLADPDLQQTIEDHHGERGVNRGEGGRDPPPLSLQRSMEIRWDLPALFLATPTQSRADF